MPNPILKRAVPIPRPMAFDRYLFIGPHPDDIETACAPTVRALTDAGKRVAFLILTDGGAGTVDPALFGEELVERRREEARTSAALLGVTDVTFLPFCDGGAYTVDEAMATMAREIVRLRPEAVFAPDPDVRSECHGDHIKTGLAAKRVLMQTPFSAIMAQYGVPDTHLVNALFLYYTDKPNAFLPVSRTYKMREAALRLHKSQFTGEQLDQIVLYYTLRSIRLGWPRLLGRCDGYRAMAPVHMHCFPEASIW